MSTSKNPSAKATTSPTHEPPTNEDLAEEVTCFECGVLLRPETRGTAVSEGIDLCDTCCRNRSATPKAASSKERQTAEATRTVEPWFDDLARNTGPHT